MALAERELPPSTPKPWGRRIGFGAALLAVILGWLLWRQGTPKGLVELPAGPLTPMLSLGRSHGVVLAPDGTLWSWGAEDLGWPVLGRGSTNGANFSPNLGRIGADQDWVQVSAGQDHNLAVKSDGSIWAWGANYRGQLGNDSPGVSKTQTQPVRSVEGHDWKRVEAGSVCSYALKTNGTLWAWGLNNFSQLGIGSWVDSSSPVQVGTASNWVVVRAGGVSAGGIQSDGSLWIWGGSPALGNTTPQNRENLLVPTRVSSGTNWVDVAVTFRLWAAIQADGTLWVWGLDAPQYTGAAEATGEVPTSLGSDRDWQSVSASTGHLLLRKRDGSWWLMTPSGPGRSGAGLVRLDLPPQAREGDTALGSVAVIHDRTIWGWGTVLGERPVKDRVVAFLAERVRRMGWKVGWDEGADGKVQRDQPWPIRSSPPK